MSHWCQICHSRPVSHEDDGCPGCVGDIENENQLEPITHWPPKPPPPPGLWARVWAWLETRPDWIADLGDD